MLEYIDGDNLRAVHALGPRPPLPIDTAVDWGRQLAAALAYLHDHGIVHRDLKPENMLVDHGRPPQDRRLRDGDARGARRLTWKHLSESLGTPDYMSPEQIQGERGDDRSDIYAWGVMMYELLTGRVPFRGDNWMAVMAGHLGRDTRARSHKLRPDVPAGARGRRHARHAPLPRPPLPERRRAPRRPRPARHARPVDLRPHAGAADGRAWRRSDSTERLWLLAVVDRRVGFLGVVGVIITLSVVL